MSFFNTVYHVARQLNPIYEIFLKENLIRVALNEQGGMGFKFYKSHDPKVNKALLKLRDDGCSAVMTQYCMAQLITYGPKIFRPNIDNIEALENMTLNIDIENYIQPFPTIIIEFPDKYSEKLIVQNPTPGNHPGGFKSTDKHDPRYVILHHNAELKVIIVCIGYSSSVVYNSCIYNRKDENLNLENLIVRNKNLGDYEDSLEVTQEEHLISERVIRASLNCVLAMEEFGIKKLGPTNQSHYDRLVRRATNKHDPEKAEAAKREARQMPVLYSFDQNIKLYTTERNTVGDTVQNAPTTMKPHWRCGHYRMQHYGVNNSLVKRIRIAPVLVNAYLFQGKFENTTYTKEI